MEIDINDTKYHTSKNNAGVIFMKGLRSNLYLEIGDKTVEQIQKEINEFLKNDIKINLVDPE